MPSSSQASPTKLGGWAASQRSNGGSVSPTKPSSRAATPISSAPAKSATSSALPTRHIPPGCHHLSSLLHLGAPSSTASSPTKIKSEDGDDPTTSGFETLPPTTKLYLKRYIAGLRWGAQIRTGHVKMMDEEEKHAELQRWNDELAKANKQGRQAKKRRKLDYPQCHTCQADMLRPFICLECAFTGCFSPPIDDDPTAVTRTAADSHMIQHLRTKKHTLAFDLLYGHLYCADCKDFIQDPIFESIQRHEICRVPARMIGQQFGPSKPTVEALFPPSSTSTEAAAMSNFYQTRSSSVTCRVPRGLRNMGATCFMNVIIQAFLHNPLLRNYFLSDRHNPALCIGAKTCLACEMDKIFAEFYSTDPGALAATASSSAAVTTAATGTAPGAVVGGGVGGGENGTNGAVAKGPHGPTSFLYCLWIDQASSELGQAGQHDAHELFISALNSIHNALTSRALERSALPSFAYEHSDALNLLFDHYEGGTGSGNQSEDEGMSGGVGSTPMGLGTGGSGGVAGCPCVVHRTFAGQLQSDVTCQRCGKTNTTRDPMLDLSLDVRPESIRRKDATLGGGAANANLNSKSKLANGKSAALNPNEGPNAQGEEEQHLTICLQRYCSEEKLGNNDYACTACGGSASATKQLSLYRLPPVLCIQLKRFEHTSAAAKIDTKVRFPLVLDVRQFSTAEIRAPDQTGRLTMANGSTRSSKDSGLIANPDPDAYLYDLFTVVVHEGSMNTGHYTNYCKWRGNWYRFDDDKVQPTTEAHVLQARAYQLCYRRRVLKNITNSRSQTHS